MVTNTNTLISLFKLAQEITYTPFDIKKEYKKFLQNKIRENNVRQRKIPCETESLKREIANL